MPTVMYPAYPVFDPATGEPLLTIRGEAGRVVQRGTETDVTLVDSNGLSMSQPLYVTDQGFLPTFGVVEGLTQVDFISGDVRMPITSPTGLEASAAESAADADASRVAAELAAATAQVPADEAVEAGIARADIPGQIAAATDSRVTELVDEQVPMLVNSTLAADPTVANAAAAAMQSAGVIAQVTWPRGALTTSSLINNLRTQADQGLYRVTTTTVANALGLPESLPGSLTVTWLNGTTSALAMQRFESNSGKIWLRSKPASVDTWTTWYRETLLRGALPSGSDLNTVTLPGIYRVSAVQLPTILNLPPAATSAPVGVLRVDSLEDGNLWGSQTYYVHGVSPEIWWRMSRTTTPTWNPWVRVYPTATAAAVPASYPTGTPNEMRVQSFRDAYPLTKTAGKGAVVFRYDHGLTNIKSTLLPLHQARNVPLYIAMNSRNWAEAESSGATQADARAWLASGLVTFGNHGTDHNDHDTPSELYDNIVNGRIELETQLGTTIHGFTIPGVGGTGLGGFGSGTMDTFSTTLAGSLILANHGVTSGVVGPTQRVMDGVVRQGGRHLTWEAMTWTAIKTQIDSAIANKTALTLMCHPRLMGATGQWTPELAAQVINYVADAIDAGQLARLSYYESLHATTTA